jgi:predicted transcriptional regulator of viral defense system
MIDPTLKELENSLSIMNRYDMEEAWLERIDGKLYTFQSRPSGEENIYVTESTLIDWIENLKN